MKSEVAQSCPTVGGPMDCSLPGSSAHGIFQARVLEWGASALLLNQRNTVETVYSLLSPSLHEMLEKAMAPHSSTLAWKIPWAEEPGRLQSMGL